MVWEEREDGRRSTSSSCPITSCWLLLTQSPNITIGTFKDKGFCNLHASCNDCTPKQRVKSSAKRQKAMMVKDGRTQPPPSQSCAQFCMGIHTIRGLQREGNINTIIVAACVGYVTMLAIYFRYQLLVGFLSSQTRVIYVQEGRGTCS